jgi:hypothetical protein
MSADSTSAASIIATCRSVALLAIFSSSFALADESTALASAPAAETAATTTTTAAEPTVPPAVATAEPEPESWTKHVKLEGLLDTFYSFNFAGFSRSPSTFRVFDAANSTFNVAYAEVALSVIPKPVGFRLDVGFGPVADLTSYDAADPLAPGISEVLKHFQQAYGSIALGDSGWTVDAGKFVTTAGAEVIEARNDWNYSRSLLFGYAIPFTHTGIRIGGPVSSIFSLQASLVNGWEVVSDNNRYKTIGLSGTLAPPTGTTAILTVYAGPEGERATPWRNLADVVVLQKIGGPLTVGLNADYGLEGDSRWFGAALMADYRFTPAFRLAARVEQFHDPDNARGIGSIVTEGTLTAAFAAGNSAEIRAEVRADTAPDPVFASGTAHRQATAQVAMLASF